MEINKIKINQKNAADQSHGYWEDHRDDDMGRKHAVGHLYNDRAEGLCINYINNEKYHQVNRKLGRHVGCEVNLLEKIQLFHNKPRNHFGEEIKWK